MLNFQIKLYNKVILQKINTKRLFILNFILNIQGIKESKYIFVMILYEPIALINNLYLLYEKL